MYVLVINCMEMVCDFVMMVFKVVGIEFVWLGKVEYEIVVDVVIGK